MNQRQPFACLMGGVDLLRAVARAGIPCVSVSAAGAWPRWSRYVKASVTWHDGCAEPEALFRELQSFARNLEERPVLFYQGDADALFISRWRDELAPYFRFLMPSRELMEDLIDKARFARLAQELELPVPSSLALPIDSPPERSLGISFPAIVKPLARQLAIWQPYSGHTKALRVNHFDELLTVWREAAQYGTALLVQQFVAGDETRVESYHVYVDDDGGIAAEFTGRKVRTFPVCFGHSTALELSDAPDLRVLGGEIVRRIGLRGVAKLDFKRDDRGMLHLLEINPRFNLWHHLAAVAGLNIPAVVYADLTGTSRPPNRSIAVGARWSKPLEDLKAVRAAGGSVNSWLRWTMTARAWSGVHLDDPMPMVAWMFARLSRLRWRAHSDAAPQRVSTQVQGP